MSEVQTSAHIKKQETSGPWAPFVRDDIYGALGLGPKPWWEKLRLLIFTPVVLPVRFVLAVTCVFFVWVASRLELAGLLSRSAGRAVHKFLVRCALFAIGFVWITFKRQRGAAGGGQPDGGSAAGEGPVLICSNHISWVDIMLFNYLHCPGYVARSGTENIPLVGPVSRYQGCLYVQREAKREDASTHGGTAPQREPSGGVAMQLRDHLLSLDDKRRRGEWYAPFLLFPEGTTTNGRGLIQFKRGPFIAGLPARPYFIQYHKCLVSPAWETIGIKEHMWYMLAGLFHSATVTELPTYYPSEAERKDASLYAENFRQHMAKMAGVPTFDASLKDKRDYQEALRGLQARRGASAHSHVKSQ